MKYLKKYHVYDRFSKENKIFESLDQKEIHKLCDEYRIRNYIINDDGSIDVEGDVGLARLGLTKLPLKFRNVSGSFFCGDNQLVTLVGAPQSVGGKFVCDGNQLTTLEGAPQSVGDGFYCHNNQLRTLEGAPQSVGGYLYFNNNPVNLIVRDWIKRGDKDELIRYFLDLDVIQDDRVNNG
jgi:hypothetical protein